MSQARRASRRMGIPRPTPMPMAIFSVLFFWEGGVVVEFEVWDWVDGGVEEDEDDWDVVWVSELLVLVPSGDVEELVSDESDESVG